MSSLSYGMFDGTFYRDELQILLARLAGVTDVVADLRESGWPCTITGKVGNLELQIVSRPLWARGQLVIALNPRRRQQLATALETITHPRIWLHAEPGHIELNPSPTTEDLPRCGPRPPQTVPTAAIRRGCRFMRARPCGKRGASTLAGTCPGHSFPFPPARCITCSRAS